MRQEYPKDQRPLGEATITAQQRRKDAPLSGGENVGGEALALVDELSEGVRSVLALLVVRGRVDRRGGLGCSNSSDSLFGLWSDMVRGDENRGGVNGKKRRMTRRQYEVVRACNPPAARCAPWRSQCCATRASCPGRGGSARQLCRPWRCRSCWRWSRWSTLATNGVSSGTASAGSTLTASMGGLRVVLRVLVRR